MVSPGKNIPQICIVLLGLAVMAFCVYKIFFENNPPAQVTPLGKIKLTDGSIGARITTQPRPLRKAPLRVALAPVISPEKSLEKYHDFVEYLGERIGRKTATLYRQSYAETNELIRHDGCDLAFVCTYLFVQAERDYGLEILAVPQIEGKTTYQSYIIVSRSDNATSLLDLHNRRFASSDLLSNSGWLYPAVWLLENGLNPDSFFSNHLITGSHDRSVDAVAIGYVDGAAVDSLVYDHMCIERPEISEKTKIIKKSPDFGMPPFVVHPRLDAQTKDALRKAMLSMHTTAAGRRHLEAIGIEKFTLPDKEKYNSVREAARLWESHRQ